MTEPAAPAPSRRQLPGLHAFARLSRRVRALLIGAVTFLVLFILMLTLPVPYVILSPGPTFNTLGADDSGNQIIVINGGHANATTGHLNMTTVDVSTTAISAFEAFAGWLIKDEVVVPKAAVYPPGQSEQQVNQQNTADFAASQDSALAAASCELGYPKGFGLLAIVANGPSDGRLHVGDALVSVDGKATDSFTVLKSVLAAETPGKTVPVVVIRAGQRLTEQVTLGAAPQGQAGAVMGISPGTACLMPFSIDLGLGNQIGGPSAGLMFALGIMDKIGKQDLTQGRFIAGTGTITPDGTVGPIGGIQLKMIAARRAGATVFLAPAGNCSDVRADTPAGLDVIRVDNLHDAVHYLTEPLTSPDIPHC